MDIFITWFGFVMYSVCVIAGIFIIILAAQLLYSSWKIIDDQPLQPLPGLSDLPDIISLVEEKRYVPIGKSSVSVPIFLLFIYTMGLCLVVFWFPVLFVFGVEYIIIVCLRWIRRKQKMGRTNIKIRIKRK